MILRRLAVVAEKLRSWLEFAGLLALTHGLHTVLIRYRLAIEHILYHDDFYASTNTIQSHPILSPVGAVPVPLPARSHRARPRFPNRSLPCGFASTCGSWRFLCRTVRRPRFCNVLHATALIPGDHVPLPCPAPLSQ